MSGARGLHRLEVCELVPPLRFLVHLIRVVAGGARLTGFCFLCPASAVWRRVGSAGLAAHGSLVLHLLPWRAILRALCNAVGIQSPAFAQGGSAPEGGPAILPAPHTVSPSAGHDFRPREDYRQPAELGRACRRGD